MDSSAVPECPQGLSVSKSDFIGPEFSVDSFLTRWHALNTSRKLNNTSDQTSELDVLRDDLGIYLKVLRSAMIELINRDYADFVNLSTNLHLDSGIAKVREPLLEFRTQVESVRNSISENLTAIKTELDRRTVIYEKKSELQNIEHIANTINKVERILGQSSADDGGALSGDVVERVAAEINYLNFCVSKCKAEKFVSEVKPRLSAIGDKLRGSLESQLLEAIESGNAEVLKRSLRIFSTLGKVKDAEKLVKDQVIAPELEKIINENSLIDSNLKNVFADSLGIIPDRMKLLLSLTNSSGHQHHLKKGNHEKDYDFVVNAFFPKFFELVSESESLSRELFSAGNPNKFFSNFKMSTDFLSELERRHCHSVTGATVFRESPAYKNFTGRFNLPVYYQIRFQEIAHPLEVAVSRDSFWKLDQTKEKLFRLRSTSAVKKAVTKCWDADSIFLPELAQKFWKLTLQILSRYSEAAKIASEIEYEIEDNIELNSKTPTVNLKPSASSKNVKDNPQLRLGHARSGSDQGPFEAKGEAAKKVSTYKSRPEELSRLWCDIEDLASWTESEDLLASLILPCLNNQDGEGGSAIRDLLSKALNDSALTLRNVQPELSKSVTDFLLREKCLPHLKQVTDIPRLYRRTNREVPSKALNYVGQICDHIKNFKMEFNKQSDCIEGGKNGAKYEMAVKSWCLNVAEGLASQYVKIVADVLEAVQKMEESLRRLKQVRGGSSTTAVTLNAQQKVSDDDKIRLQLYIDVMEFERRLKSDLKVAAEITINSLGELKNLVGESVKDIVKATEVIEA